MDDLSNLIKELSDEQLDKIEDMISALDEYKRLQVLGSMTDEELDILVEFQKSAKYKMKSGEANG